MRKPVSPPVEAKHRSERRHSSKAPETRSEFGRDRDRILYSSAFLRLGRVTQVASPEIGHIFHSRLTHSLKVAQVARRLAERLRTLNLADGARVAVESLHADAVEASALAHDLGHPPFGHLAEQELNDQAKAFGGFEGNAQSFRILTRLAARDALTPGLNLTRQTLEGSLKYPWLRHPDVPRYADKWGAYDADRGDFEWVRSYSDNDVASLEARIMDWADDVTYAVHDMDDFFRAGLIPLELLCRGGEALARFRAYVAARHPAAEEVVDSVFAMLAITERYEGTLLERAQLRAMGSFLITRYIQAFRVVADADGIEIEIDDQIANEVAVLKSLIWFYIIERASLAVVQHGQRRVIRELVRLYMRAVEEDDRRVLPLLFQQRLDSAGTDDARRRVVIDLVAGMTEESALEVYKRAIGGAPASLLSAPHI